MLDITNRQTDAIFNLFLFYQNLNGNYKITYPASVPRENISRIVEFGPSCCKEHNLGEFYILLFTDAEGRSEYVHCFQASESHFLCFASYLPWFEGFRFLLEEIKRKELYKREWSGTLRSFLETLRTLPIPTSDKNFLLVPPPLLQDSNRSFWFYPASLQVKKENDIRLHIPSFNDPFYSKSFELYYSALEPLQWIDIFTSMLLEKSFLFFSKNRERLTLCIFAAVSLLYPVSWVSPVYPLLTRKLLPVLGSPVPFIAGIHACLFEEAQQYITHGTRVIDLDSREIRVNVPDNELDAENIPTAILDFFSTEVSSRSKQLKSAMTSKNGDFLSWKTSDMPMKTFVMQQAKPFFDLIVNLLGYFRRCVLPNGVVDFRQLILCQACAPLEPFLVRLFESQMIHCFLDDRLNEQVVDMFEVQARILADQCIEKNNYPGVQPLNGRIQKVNFGDVRWRECKKAALGNSVITHLRLRRKLGKQWEKLTSKASQRVNRLRSESTNSPVLSSDFSSSSALGYSKSFSGSVGTLVSTASSTASSSSLLEKQRQTLPPVRPPRPRNESIRRLINPTPIAFSSVENLSSSDSHISSDPPPRPPLPARQLYNPRSLTRPPKYMPTPASNCAIYAATTGNPIPTLIDIPILSPPPLDPVPLPRRSTIQPPRVSQFNSYIIASLDPNRSRSPIPSSLSTSTSLHPTTGFYSPHTFSPPTVSHSSLTSSSFISNAQLNHPEVTYKRSNSPSSCSIDYDEESGTHNDIGIVLNQHGLPRDDTASSLTTSLEITDD